MTFKPVTNEWQFKARPEGDRKLDLYNRVKQGELAAKHNKTTEEAEYEKNMVECSH